MAHALETPAPASAGAHREHAGLQPSLKQRHLSMIALGGVIGAGLFVGSSAVIAATGPAAVLSYLLAGALVVLVMRMLGEMASANPSVGSFAEYARRSLGGWAGFSVGWLYWYFWVVVIGFEAVAGAVALDRWFDLPLWVMALVPMLVLTGVNLTSVKNYGEFEFWFASIKVVAIILFILMGLAFVVGLWPGQPADVSNLVAEGGFAPNGVMVMLSAMAVVILAFVGAEIVTIAAAESAEPEKMVAKATNSVIARVLIFYVGSILLLVTILPWNQVEVGQSPFVSALGRMGIPAATEIMNAIVITAVLSCLNSGIYTASRMLFALARRGDAPDSMLEVSPRGVPVKGILLCTVAGYVAVAMAYISPETVFSFMINSSGALGLFVYILIAFSQLRMRPQLERDAPDRIRVRMWGYPWLTWVAIVGMGAVLVAMFLRSDTRPQVLFGLISVLAVLAIYWVRERRRAESPLGVQAAR
jgi:GABA permease